MVLAGGESASRKCPDAIRDCGIGETRDLSAGRPELAAKLRKTLGGWRKALGSRTVTVKPQYDPSADRRDNPQRMP